jgi:hypothetical protein
VVDLRPVVAGKPVAVSTQNIEFREHSVYRVAMVATLADVWKTPVCTKTSTFGVRQKGKVWTLKW